MTIPLPETMDECPVCREKDIPSRHVEMGRFRVRCHNCGDFELTFDVRQDLASILKKTPMGAQRLSHGIRKMSDGGVICVLDSASAVDQIVENTPLPKPREQADILVLWLGQNTKGFGDTAKRKTTEWTSIIGGWDETNFKKLLAALNEERLVGYSEYGDSQELNLLISGWNRYEELRRGQSHSRKAFMAMQYGNDQIERMYRDCFKPAVKAAGFDLFLLKENPRAGVIDNRMRVDIRTSRFLIADLTGKNAGAYWEAGFAEGLGKPVIYTCEENFFRSREEGKGTHFDANHCTTILWSDGDPNEAAASELTATIRASLPTEAKLEDRR